MSESSTLKDKHIELVSILLKQLEDDSNRDVMKKENGNFAMIKNLGVENTSYAADNFNRLCSTLEDYKDNNLFTDKDLKVAALYADNTASEIKKSAQWDATAPTALSFWVALFGYLIVIKMNVLSKEEELTVLLFTGALVLIGAGFRAFLAHRRSQTLKQSIRYSQVEKFIKSLL